MKKFIANLIENFFSFQQKYLEKKYENSMTKNHITSSATLTFSVELQKNKEKIEEKIKNIAKENINNPVQLLEIAEKEGVKSYFIKNAEKKLKPINEKAGFILPKKGFGALYLNFLLFKNFSFNTPFMFIFEDENLSIYRILYNFYMYNAYMANLPGFNSKYILKVKNLENLEKENFEKLKYKDIVDLKEAIARDRDASNFVVQFIKEIEGAKKAYDTLKNNENGTNI